MRGRPVAVLSALAVAAALMVAPFVAAPATAAASRCAAYGDVVRETAAGGTLAGRTPMLVASYNIGGYNAAKSQAPWETRANKLVSMITRCSPDVIGLQEASEAWMQRRPAGSRNHSQYEHVVDLMNARTPGSPYRVTNTHRAACPTTGRNRAVWNGRWQGGEAPWRTCETSRSLTSSDNRTVYDSRVLAVIDHGARHLPSATNDVQTVDWAVFRVKRTGQRFLFANTHLDARYRGEATGSRTSNSFRRKQVTHLLAAVRQVRAQHGMPPVVLVGDMNSTGRARMRTPVDDLTRAGLVDLLGTDRRWYRSKRNKWRGSCRSVGVTKSLRVRTNPRVPLHVKRRIHAYYNTSNNVAGRKAGSGKNVCMYRNSKLKRTRGARPGKYYRHQGVRLDYILTSSNMFGRGWETVVDANLRRAKYRSTPPSDHNMIAATLAF